MLELLEMTRGETLGGILLTTLLLWVLVRQWDRLRRFLVGYPILGAIIEAGLIILMTYTCHGLLVLLGSLPRLEDWQYTANTAAALTIHLGYALATGHVIAGILRKRRHGTAETRLPKLVRGGYYGLFLLLGVITYLVATGQTPTELFVWGGATAALLAFVMQQTLGDLFSGLALTMEKPLEIGDWIRLSDGTEGEVQDINWRATRLRRWDNSTFVIPNGQLAKESFTNLHGPRHRFAPWYTVQVSGDHAPEEVIALLRAAIGSCKVPLREPAPVVRLMNAETTPYTYMVWVTFANYPTMFAGRAELYEAVDAALRAAGLQIAADIQEIRLRQPEAERAVLPGLAS